MEIYVNKFFISIFSLFFSRFKTILPDSLILPLWQLRTQQLMTSQIRSYIEYQCRLIIFFC